MENTGKMDSQVHLAEVVENNSENESLKKVKKSWKFLYGGMIFILISTFFYANVLVFAKILKENHNYRGFATTFWRYVVSFGVSIPIIMILESNLIEMCVEKSSRNKLSFVEKGVEHNDQEKKDKAGVFSQIWPPSDREHLKNLGGLLLRGILGPTTVIFKFCALDYLASSDVSIISSSYPVLVLFLARLFLGEKLRICHIIMALLDFVGIALIARPAFITGKPYDPDSLIGFGLAVLALVTNAFAIILNRKLRKVHWTVMIFVISAFGLVLGIVTSLGYNDFRYPDHFGEEFWLVFGVSMLSFGGQVLKILAYKFDKAGPLTLLRTTHPIFVFILAFLYLGEKPDFYSLIGGSIVVFAVSLIGFSKWIGSLDNENRIRKLFWFLLK